MEPTPAEPLLEGSPKTVDAVDIPAASNVEEDARALGSGTICAASDAAQGQEQQPSAEESSPASAADLSKVIPADAATCAPAAVTDDSSLREGTDGDGEDRCCRICFDSESTEDNPLLAPCKCAGSMRYIHRACLDQWRVHTFNPQALVGCTTCCAEFRYQYKGGTKETWWVRFAKDLACYLGIRFFAFFAATITLGFVPYLVMGASMTALHPNPVVSHLLCGSGTFFALAGTFFVVQLPGRESLRLAAEFICPRRSGKNSGEAVLIFLIVVGLLVCLFFLLRGIWRMITEGRHELLRAMRSANSEVRQQMVKDYIVLDYIDDCPQPCRATTGGSSVTTP